MLFLDKRTFIEPTMAENICCRFLNESDLQVLASTDTFGLTPGFIKDFSDYQFLCVAATIDDEVVGVIFLGSGTIPARHNSGGSAFKGIAVDSPNGAFYLFKVDVLASHRGRKINAAMISYAVSTLQSKGLVSIVTTTDWTNEPFLKSTKRLGFLSRGHASEFVFSGRHAYLLPKPLDPVNGNSIKDVNAAAIRFFGR